MQRLAILCLFLPLVAFGMDPTDDSKLPTDKGNLLPASSATTLDDIHTEVRDGTPASAGRVMARSGHGKRRSIRRTAVIPGGPLDIEALRKELETDGSALSTRTQPSATDCKGFPSHGEVQPPKWVKGLNMPCQKPEDRDSKTVQSGGAAESSGVVLPPKWQAELRNQSKQ